MTRRPQIVFRADASLAIGTGHVMRCMTLAQTLMEKGADCLFLCREHEGNLLELIRDRGIAARALPLHDAHDLAVDGDVLSHASWLGTDWSTDAADTIDALQGLRPDWLVLDHYALDWRWETALRARYGRLMVIDDLADRRHACDALLDQNLGRRDADYHDLIPAETRLFIGPIYALLRRDFAALRPASLSRRGASAQVRHILISMGGVDQPNATGRTLAALDEAALPGGTHITVVMGPHAPWLEEVRIQAGKMEPPVEVLTNVADMASLMAKSDVAIGAAGTTSWERCSLGLPALIVVLADNQRDAARALELEGAAIALGAFPGAAFADEVRTALAELLHHSEKFGIMSEAAAAVTNGHGADRLASYMVHENDT